MKTFLALALLLLGACFADAASARGLLAKAVAKASATALNGGTATVAGIATATGDGEAQATDVTNSVGTVAYGPGAKATTKLVATADDGVAHAHNGVSQEFANSDVAAGAQLLADVLTNGTHPPLVAGTIAAGDGAIATNEVTSTASGNAFHAVLGDADVDAFGNAIALGAGSEAGSKVNAAASYGGKATVGNFALAHGSKADGGSVANAAASANAAGPNSVEVANAALAGPGASANSSAGAKAVGLANTAAARSVALGILPGSSASSSAKANAIGVLQDAEANSAAVTLAGSAVSDAEATSKDSTILYPVGVAAGKAKAQSAALSGAGVATSKASATTVDGKSSLAQALAGAVGIGDSADANAKADAAGGSVAESNQLALGGDVASVLAGLGALPAGGGIMILGR